jgi:putative two-component system hydrogenase maturation factor HypX/HoxX
MGNLYGSEYWSYLLPRYAGEENAARIAAARLPMGVEEAAELGLVDRVFADDNFLAEVGVQAEQLAVAENFESLLAQKVARRRRDEAQKPLQRYREEELERMRLNFYGFDSSYHVARYNFVCKVPKSRTPLTIAGHRRRDASLRRIV